MNATPVAILTPARLSSFMDMLITLFKLRVVVLLVSRFCAKRPLLQLARGQAQAQGTSPV